MLLLALSQFLAQVLFSTFELFQLCIHFSDLSRQLFGFQNEAYPLDVLELLADFLVASSFRGLTLEGSELPFDFQDDVVDANEILLRQLQFEFRTSASTLVAADAGGFLNNNSPLIGFGAEQPADSSLRNQRIRGETQSCLLQNLVNILQAAMSPVDRIDALSGAIELSTDLQSLSRYSGFL